MTLTVARIKSARIIPALFTRHPPLPANQMKVVLGEEFATIISIVIVIVAMPLLTADIQEMGVVWTVDPLASRIIKRKFQAQVLLVL